MIVERPRIIFMGTPDFAVPSVRALVEAGYPVVSVVTAPDKPRGRGQQVSFTAVKEEALRLSIPVLQPDLLKDPSFAATLEALSADLMVVVAFRILPPSVFTLPRLGAFNLHASLLPRYRGAAPIQWAVINGDTETGVTTFLLQQKVDTGSVLLQERSPIGPHETAGDLHDRLALIGAEVVIRTVRGLADGTLTPRAQDDTLATAAPKLFKEDGRLDWNRPATALYNRIRGLSPIPTAWTMLGEHVWKIYRSRVVEVSATGAIPGTVIGLDRASCIIQTGEGALALEEVMLEGRKRMGIEEFLRGYRIALGTKVGP
ncbi:MAG: methionyl-tRNA formyltransferase [Bacteroidetes bacterium]|jgi:methionyl-tRNA formyltransferase|nr:methionyl-tRNA formyltransferase [Bacteroidota bacterium]